MKRIPLTKGKYALVDNSFYKELMKHKWTFHSRGYAYRQIVTKKRNIQVYMHRQITHAQKGKDVDHINGNGLDNRKKNLRVGTHRENLMNRGIPKNNTSGFKGVYWNRSARRWVAQLNIKGKAISLGCFKDILDAAKEYNKQAKKHFKKFAYLNKIP